jgi:arabinogalactan endo-1,4-beta-galactosidase
MFTIVGELAFGFESFEIILNNGTSKLFTANENIKIIINYKGFEGEEFNNGNQFQTLLTKEGVGQIEVIKDSETFNYKFRAKDGCLSNLIKITNEYRKAGVTVDIRSY